MFRIFGFGNTDGSLAWTIACGLLILIWLLLLTRECQIFLASRRAFKWVMRCLNDENSIQIDSENTPHLILLLPALREQSVIRETIEHFKQLPYDKDKLRIVIITAEKEEFELEKLGKGSYPTTAQLADLLIAEYGIGDIFLHMHSPETTGNKSTQLNYALMHIDEIGFPGDKTYIGVYDFDSLPATETLRYIAYECVRLNSLPAVFQQGAFSLKNFQKLGTGLGAAVLRAEAMMHAMRVFGVELGRTLAREPKSQVTYCVGAGLFVRQDILQAVGGFPLFVDDITLGYKLSLIGAKFRPIPFPNYVEMTRSLPQYVNQFVLIFRGIVSFVDVLGRFAAPPGYRRSQIKAGQLILTACMDVLEVTAFPLALLALVPAALFGHPWLWSTLLVIFHITGWVYAAYLSAMVRKMAAISCLPVSECGAVRFGAAVLVAPLRRVWRCFGSHVFLWRAVCSLVTRRQMCYTKTER